MSPNTVVVAFKCCIWAGAAAVVVLLAILLLLNRAAEQDFDGRGYKRWWNDVEV